MKRRTRVGLTILCILLALAWFTAWLWQITRAEVIKDKCMPAYLELANALSEWNSDHAKNHLGYDNYPDSLDQLKEAGYLPHLPANPFGSGRLKELRKGDPNQVGGMRYIPLSSTYTLDNGTSIKETDYYLIVVYAPRNRQKGNADELSEQLARLGPGSHWYAFAPQGYRLTDPADTVVIAGVRHKGTYHDQGDIVDQLRRSLDGLGYPK